MASQYEGDYEFEDAFITGRRGFPGQGVFTVPIFPGLEAKTKDYSDIALSFTTDMRRTASLWILPSEIIFWTHHHTICSERARVKVGLGDTDELQTPEHLEVYRDIFIETLLQKLAPGRAAFQSETMTWGNSQLKYFLEREKNPPPGFGAFLPAFPVLGQGIEAILSTMLTASYAALETLATDLWIAAMNRHWDLAAPFMQRIGDKKIDFDRIVQEGGDVRKSMGRLLYSTNKTSFRSFNDIQASYKNAFGKDLQGTFDDSSKVYQAEQIRHLIAHRGGVVDGKFKEKMKDVQEFQGAEIGEYLELSGPFVKANLEACVRCAMNIFRFVDDWSVEKDKAT